MENRGILLLCDPLTGGSSFTQTHSNTKALVFQEGGRFLSQAQEALYRMRQRCGWVCVAASGGAVGLALSLAAQLMVDRLALWPEPEEGKAPRELRRIKLHAQRNLWLIACEVLLVGPEGEARSLARGLGRSSECRWVEPETLDWKDLTADWDGELFSDRH